MQLKLKDIVNNVSKKNNLDKDVLQSISNIVFQDIAFKIKHPTNLIVYVDGLGKIYARNKKTKNDIGKIDYLLEHPRPNITEANLIRNKEYMLFLLNRYEDFKKHKNQYKNDNNDNPNN